MHYRKCRKHEPCREVWQYPPGKLQIWRLRNVIFSPCHEICLRKHDLEYVNGKQLQVTITKITESKENKSIHRLDLSGSTGRGGGCLRLAPLLATALECDVRYHYVKGVSFFNGRYIKGLPFLSRMEYKRQGVGPRSGAYPPGVVQLYLCLSCKFPVVSQGNNLDINTPCYSILRHE